MAYSKLTAAENHRQGLALEAEILIQWRNICYSLR
jgi:hypothetical protein